MPDPYRTPRPVLFAISLLPVLIAGCPSNEREARERRPPPIVSIPPPQTNDPNERELPDPIQVSAREKPWITAEDLPWERWYLQYINGKRVGYSHVVVDKSPIANDLERIRIERADVIELEHEGQVSLYHRLTESVELIDGHPISFWDTTRSGDRVIQKEGNLLNNRLTLVTKVNERPTSAVINWEDGTWGMMGIQAILMQRPPQPGELLAGRFYLSQINKVVSVEMLADQPDITSLPGGRTESLLPVDIVLWGEDDNGVRSRNWINEDGEILKTVSMSGRNMSTFLAPKEIALRTRDELALAAMLERSVPLAKYPYELSRPQRIVYEIGRTAAGSKSELSSLIARSKYQQVKAPDALSARVTVTSGTTSSGGGESTSAPAADYLQSSSLMPSDHELLQQRAEAWSGDASSLAQVALKLTGEVKRAIKTEPVDREVKSVLKVIREGQGDCVEQATLLAGLLRAKGIPARVAAGWRVDHEHRGRMVFHMWTEAWLEGNWIPLDAISGEVAAADRIKLGDSALVDPNPYSVILPVFEAMAGLEIRVIDEQ